MYLACPELRNSAYSAWLSGINQDSINKLIAYYRLNPAKLPDVIFADTIRENIIFGRDIEDDAVNIALRDAMALEFVEERGKAEAVASFKLRIFYAEMIEASFNRRAGLYLMLAWIFRDAGERENEMEMLGRAAELYDRSLTTEEYPQNGMSEGLCMFLIGAIYYRKGDIEKSTQYLSRIIGDQSLRTSDSKLYDRARNLWEDVRAAKKESAEEESS